MAKKRETAGIGAPLKAPEKTKSVVSEKKSEPKEQPVVSIFINLSFLGNGFVKENVQKKYGVSRGKDLIQIIIA